MIYPYIILKTLHSLENERSISAVYYLLQGKQSIQTIQDADLFKIGQFFGVYKKLSKVGFIKTVEQLENDAYIIKQEKKNYYILSAKGIQYVKDKEKQSLHLYFNGKKFNQIDQIYYGRLLLLIQVWTNSRKAHFKFIPIIEHKEVENWVKTYYQTTKHQIDQYLRQLYEELVDVLSLLPERHATIFINQLSGYQTIGMTTSQLSNEFQMSEEDVHLITISIIHFILEKISMKQKSYPILFRIMADLIQIKSLTESAKKTEQLLHKGYSISQIASFRKLKTATIYDHIVEISLHDEQFPLHLYVDEQEQQQIIHAINQLQTYKLKEIKSAVSEEITYFQIRLVLTNFKLLRGEKAATTK